MKLLREKSQNDIEALRFENERLLRDAQADEVGKTLAELRRLYEDTIQSLRESFIEAES